MLSLSPPTPVAALRRYLLPAAAAAMALVLGWLTSRVGPAVPAALLALPLLLGFVALVFWQPRVGVIALVCYCFAVPGLNRHVPEATFGLGMEGLLLLTWVAVAFNRRPSYRLVGVRNDLCALALAWFVVNLLELLNPTHASFNGWFYEMRGITLYWFLSVPLAWLVFSEARDLKLFLGLVIGLSVLGTLYGMKQQLLGVNEMEKRWLDEGAHITHILWGQLRIFSYYSEAAQFGASQAHIALVCLILAAGPFTTWKRVLLASAGLLLLYGMLISGTRGALFVLAAGGLVYLLLSRQLLVLALGLGLMGGAFGVLKFTYIGNGIPSIVRLRTALDTQDPSLLVRLENQALLRDYLADRPFGGGVGTTGMWGTLYNPNQFLATIPPDSLFVKVWVEYGVVGLIIWLGIMLYTLGKCCGIALRIRDPLLRQQLLALTAGFAGILVSSYGNEVMNQMPSAIILYLSWVFIFRGPALDAALRPAPAPVVEDVVENIKAEVVVENTINTPIRSYANA